MKPNMAGKTVLVVDACAESRARFLEQTQGRGLSVITATDPHVALTTFQMSVPDVVITDLFGPDMMGLTLTSQIKKRRPACAVIMTGTDSTQGVVVSALKAGALDYLCKPIGADELWRSLDRAFVAIPRSLNDAPGIERLEHLVVMNTDPAHIETTISHLISGAMVTLPEPQSQHLRAALHELLLNAVEHGSLDISFPSKREALASSTYDELLSRRRLDPRYKGRFVTIRIIYDRSLQTVEFRVADEGQGFDWKGMLSRDPETVSADAPCGRGMLVARALFPDLAYNDRGNEAILTVALSA